MSYLKTRNLVGTYEHVLEADPAFDRPERRPDEDDKSWEARAKAFDDAYLRATETGDFSGLPTKDAAEPAVWRLRHLTGEQWRWVQDIATRTDGGMAQAYYHACALALVSVKGAGIDIQRGRDAARRGWEAVKAEVLDQLADQVVSELGARVVSAALPRNG